MRHLYWISLFVIFLAAAVPLADQPIENSGSDQTKFHQGQLLIANPQMPDPRFARTVIFLCRHDATGAFGLVLNRPVGVPAGDSAAAARTRKLRHELLGALGLNPDQIKGDFQLRLGGPVQPSAAFLLHSDKFGRDSQICGAHGLALTSDTEMLNALTKTAGPKRSILFLGYAGWGAGQLEAELATNSWSIAPGDPEILFDRDTGTLWERTLAKRVLDL